VKSPHKHPIGATHVFHALRAAVNGYKEAWQHEDAFRQELFVAAIAIPFALLYPTDKISKILMVSSILLVLILELVNSSIEAAVDHTSLDRHPFAKRAKDVAGAAVLTSMVNVLVVWSIILFA
jgi:diacylglycerol kinase (ATP)